MNDDIKDKVENAPEAAPEAEATAEEPKTRPITIELDDLSEEGRKRIAERLGRPVEDLPYKVVSQEPRPGSGLIVRIEVDRKVFLAEEERLLIDIGKEITLPGFRKGKAPLKLLQLRLGEDAVRDTIGSLATNAMRQEKAKQDLKIISNLRVGSFSAEAADQPVTFEIDLELEPKVELKQYKGIAVEAEEQPVTDEMVDARIEQLRQRAAVMETAEDAELKEGDYITLDMDVKNDKGEALPHLSRKDWQLYNFKQQLDPKLAEQLEGKKAGATVTAKIENVSKNRRGEDVTHTDDYTVTIKQIQREKLPALDDEFAKDLGQYQTLAELKAGVRKDIEKEAGDRERGQALGKIFEKLIELNPIDAPKSLLAKAQYDIIMEDSYQLERMGLRLEQVVQDTSAYVSNRRESAAQQVKAGMISGAISAAENLEATEADVEAEIAKMAEESGRKPLAIRARLEAQKQFDAFRGEITRRKVNDFLLANNTVTKVAPKKEEEAKEETAEEKPGKKTAKKAAKKDEKSE
ncbi:trigger factor [bacterium]|nr:trigger factor [bacterium]